MRTSQLWSITSMVVLGLAFANLSNAQQTEQTNESTTAPAKVEPVKVESVKVESVKVESVKVEPVKTSANKVDATSKNTAADKTSTEPKTKKMVESATINLQTTVTGNQEQPRVLYILPWQSPQAEEVDFESLENQQKSVFAHVERDELRRELESTEKKSK